MALDPQSVGGFFPSLFEKVLYIKRRLSPLLERRERESKNLPLYHQLC